MNKDKVLLEQLNNQSEIRKKIQNTIFPGYYKQTFIYKDKILCDTPLLTYLNFPGFITIEPHNSEIMPYEHDTFTTGFTYALHEFDMLDSIGIKPQNFRLQKPDRFEKASKKIKKTIKNWELLLNINEDFLSKENEKFSLILKPNDPIINLDIREEYFYPIAFKEEKKLVGGVYANLWQTNPISKKEEILFDAFFTGGCLFGNEVQGVDSKGSKRSLTEFYYNCEQNVKITQIEYINDRHADEILTLQSLENMLPFIHLFSSQKIPKIKYHIPRCEYILNAAHLFINGMMTEDAFKDYISLINTKAHEHLIYLNKIILKIPMNIKIVSPLENVFSKSNEIEEIICFFKDNFLHLSSQKDESALIFLFLEILKNNAKKEYAYIWEKLLATFSNEPNLLKGRKLNYISHLSYAVGIASAAGNQIVCSMEPNHEKRIQLTYKQLLSNTYGNVFCLNWIPPVLIKSTQHFNSLFYINNQINKRVKQYLDLGILEHSFKIFGAIALDDYDEYIRKIDELYHVLLSIHDLKWNKIILKDINLM